MFLLTDDGRHDPAAAGLPRPPASHPGNLLPTALSLVVLWQQAGCGPRSPGPEVPRWLSRRGPAKEWHGGRGYQDRVLTGAGEGMTEGVTGTRPRHRGSAAGGLPLAIELHGITKSFGQVRAVRGIDLTVASGEIVAFLGPNGAGKTSTIDVILGLSAPDAGQVSVYGVTPRRAVTRGLVSAVMQTGGLLKDLTVGETVEYTASVFARSQPVGEVLKRAASPASPTAGSAGAPAASSSGCASPWPWSPTRSC